MAVVIVTTPCCYVLDHCRLSMPAGCALTPLLPLPCYVSAHHQVNVALRNMVQVIGGYQQCQLCISMWALLPCGLLSKERHSLNIDHVCI